MKNSTQTEDFFTMPIFTSYTPKKTPVAKISVYRLEVPHPKMPNKKRKGKKPKPGRRPSLAPQLGTACLDYKLALPKVPVKTVIVHAEDLFSPQRQQEKPRVSPVYTPKKPLYENSLKKYTSLKKKLAKRPQSVCQKLHSDIPICFRTKQSLWTYTNH